MGIEDPRPGHCGYVAPWLPASLVAADRPCTLVVSESAAAAPGEAGWETPGEGEQGWFTVAAGCWRFGFPGGAGAFHLGGAVGGNVGRALSGGAGVPASCAGGVGLAWVTWGTRAAGAWVAGAHRGHAGAAWLHAPRSWRGRSAWGKHPALPRWWGRLGRETRVGASGPRTPEGAGRARRSQTSPGCVRRPWVHIGASRCCLPPRPWGPFRELGAAQLKRSPPDRTLSPDPLNYWRWERQWRVRPPCLSSCF